MFGSLTKPSPKNEMAPPAAMLRDVTRAGTAEDAHQDIEIDDPIEDAYEQDPFDALNFTDLLMPLTWPDGNKRPAGKYQPEKIAPREPKTLHIPPTAFDAMEDLRAHILRQADLRTGLIHVNGADMPRWHNGAVTFRSMRLRYAVSNTTRGEAWVVVRRIPEQIPTINSLGLHKDAAHVLRSLTSEKSGLVLVCGQTGAGKTTSVTATLAHGMREHGNKGYTIEDPCEYLLQGEHGHGICLQNEAEDNGGWTNAIKTALRSSPDYIMLGEIRDREVAEASIRAATTGHLVFSTIHAGSVMDGLDAIIRLTGGSDSQAIKEQIGQQLTAVIWQERKNGRVGMHILDCREKEVSKNVRKLMGENKTMALSDNDWTKKYPPMATAA